MIDTRFNSVMARAYEHIDSMARSVDGYDLERRYGVACAYLEALRDCKVLPQRGYENLLEQARILFEKIIITVPTSTPPADPNQHN